MPFLDAGYFWYYVRFDWDNQTAVSEHFLTNNHSDNYMLFIPIETLKMGVILSGKHVKPTLSIKLRQLSLWASINVINCNYILYTFYFFVILSF